MPFPMKTCVVCEEEYELKPDHPGYANRCRSCNEEQAAGGGGKEKMSAEERRNQAEMNEARRNTMRNMLYRKDS